ncbi:hypothetical protein [Bythopirellula polymerisocia]|nr:hypothetical protein [Bythopirellula polymerisocia]
MSNDNNENWGKCPKCGSPVLIDPVTSQMEPCSNCLSEASPVGLLTGTVGILLALVVVALVLFFSLRLLLG